MSKFHEKLFVAFVFIVAYAVVTENVTLTGRVITFPSFDETEPTATNFFLELNDLNAKLSLEELDSVVFKQDENRYLLSALHVEQDYSSGHEFVILQVQPGSKRLFLNEGDDVLIDFNNDGQDDVVLKLESVAIGKAEFLAHNI